MDLAQKQKQLERELEEMKALLRKADERRQLLNRIKSQTAQRYLPK